MEIDLYNRNLLSDRYAPTEYQPARTARYYPVKKSVRDVRIIPLSNVLLDSDLMAIILRQLNKVFNNKKYDKSQNKSTNVNQLNPHLKKLYQNFLLKKVMDPVIVRQINVINDPSPNDPTLPSVVALGAPMVNLFPIDSTYIYQVISGDELVAFSYYFGYDHIPAMIRI